MKETSADYYLCVARDKAEWKNITAQSDKRYHMFVFPATLLNYGTNSDWTSRSTKNGTTKYEYRPVSGAVKEASIAESMSYQLWTSVHVCYIPTHVEIVIPGRP